MIENTYKEIIKEILTKAKELNKVGDSISYIMPNGKYHLSIYLGTEFEKNKCYFATASRVVNNCAVPINENILGPSGGNRTIIKACLWFFKEINEFENTPWITYEELLAEADFIMNELDPE